MIVYGFDLYVIGNFAGVRDKVKGLSNHVIQIGYKIISDNVPKYKGE
jgi:hypothetical protein